MCFGVFHESYDLLNETDVKKVFSWFLPQYVIHLAGYNGNIQFNALNGADIFYRTTEMSLNVLKACVAYRVNKAVSVLSSCAYPSVGSVLEEKDFLNGDPDETVESHGLGKRNIFIYSKLLNKQYGSKYVSCVFNTCYGPYDSFDLHKTKVMGSLIKKFVDAVENNIDEVIIWGSGLPKREFIYCDDAAEGICQVLEKYDGMIEPINIGFQEEISIGELAYKISKLVEFKGQLIFDKTKSDGQMRKILSNKRMKEYNIDFIKTDLNDGIKKTIEWYKQYGKK